jgi:hypothetical protein
MDLHHNLLYSYIIAGHTKFGPDRCFGMVKKAYKVNYVSSLYELADMVDCSSDVGVNKAQLVGTYDYQVMVPVYDWASFLQPYFRKLPNIKKFHHFRFSRDSPGEVCCKELVSSDEQNFLLLKNKELRPPREVFPDTVRPEGLTEERKSYLYREIRQFCKLGTEDLVAPCP